MRVRTLAAAAIVTVSLGLVGAAMPAGAAQSSGRSDVPNEIKVPQGNKRVATMPARGVQTYQCTGNAWTFLQPDAILRHRGHPEALHTAGPVWTSVRDGSSVTAESVASSPVDGAIPQLLLRATDNRGPGIFADVTYIQRLDTRGGLAPTGACTDGTTVSVRYSADYVFWVAR